MSREVTAWMPLHHAMHQRDQRAFSRASARTRGAANRGSVAVAELSLLAAEHDDWPTAQQRAGETLDLVTMGHLEDQLFSILSYTAARVARPPRGP